jgi:hypothetical protein
MARDQIGGVQTTGPELTARAGRRRLLRVAAGGGALAGVALLAGSRPTSVAARPAGAGIVGAWLLTVPTTPRGRFITVQTFAADGTAVGQYESAGEERGATLGIGVWAPTGERTYALSFAAGLYDASTGATLGVAKVNATLVLDATGDAWRGEGQITIVDPDGGQVEQTPRFPVSATRITLEPLP